jgi:hypothetical protein
MNAQGKPFNSLAHTLNVSKSGALLANVDVPLNCGDVIGVQKGVYKCKFRVRWIGKKGTVSQGQLGIESVEGPKNIWGIDDLPHSIIKEKDAADRRSFVGGGHDHERRSATRFPCDLGVQVGQSGSDMKTWARSTDISETGCYIDTACPLPSGKFFVLTLFLGSETIIVPSEVRTSFPSIGMGVQFQFTNEDDFAVLSRYLRQKFGLQPVPTETQTSREFAELDKLGAFVEQMRTWAISAHLDGSDREELEQFAATTRREFQGFRAELSRRKMAESVQTIRKVSG